MRNFRVLGYSPGKPFSPGKQVFSGLFHDYDRALVKLDSFPSGILLEIFNDGSDQILIHVP